MLDEKVYQDIVRRVNRRYRRRGLATTHLLLLIVAYALAGPAPTSGFFSVWLLVVLVHLVQVAFLELRDRAIRREVQRELEHMRAYTLGSDFAQRQARLESDVEVELFQVVDDEWDRKRKRV